MEKYIQKFGDKFICPPFSVEYICKKVNGSFVYASRKGLLRDLLLSVDERNFTKIE